MNNPECNGEKYTGKKERQHKIQLIEIQDLASGPRLGGKEDQVQVREMYDETGGSEMVKHCEKGDAVGGLLPTKEIDFPSFQIILGEDWLKRVVDRRRRRKHMLENRQVESNRGVLVFIGCDIIDFVLIDGDFLCNLSNSR